MSALPTRVIDVGGGSNPPKLCIIPHGHGLWVALSHCWGVKARFVTEATSLLDRQEAMALEDMPATFRDAIVTTRKLGYQYLWIDSLCIIQDSLEDWAYESSQMQHYYKNAILTIATDHLTGDHESFLEDIRTRDSTSIRIPCNASLTSTATYLYIRDRVYLPGYENDNAPLNKRGWTLQENLLSPRTLHYTEQQIVFECQKYSVTESDFTPRGTSDADVFTAIKRFFLRPECSRKDLMVIEYPTMAAYYEPLFRWYQVFEEYYNRYLTFEDDRFAAISGLAREISQQSKMTYKAGIWVEDFHVGLLWNVSCRGSLPKKYRAPSWSWASLDINMNLGNTHFELYIGPRNYGASYPEAELLEMDVELADGDPYGRLLSGSLRLSGPWLPYRLWSGKRPTYFATFWREPNRHQAFGSHRPDGQDQLICSFDEEEDYESESESILSLEAPADKSDARDVDPSIHTNPHDHFPSETAPHPEQNPSSSSQTDLMSSSASDIEEEDEEARYSWESAVLDDVSMLQIARCTSKVGEGEMSVFYALLLRPVVGQEHLFRRVGRAEIPDVDGLVKHGWETKVCVIV